jgi:hypothetical protein
MISFEQLLSRADVQLLDDLIPKGAGQIIKQINTDLNYTSRLSQLIVNLVSPQGLLLQQNSRVLLIDILPPKDAKDLAELMGGRANMDHYEFLKTLKLTKLDDKIKFLHFFGQVFFKD